MHIIADGGPEPVALMSYGYWPAAVRVLLPWHTVGMVADRGKGFRSGRARGPVDWIPQSVIIRIGRGAFVLQEMLRVQRRHDGVKWQRRLVVVKAIGEVVGVRIGISE
jgi:hypothetical protein